MNIEQQPEMLYFNLLDLKAFKSHILCCFGRKNEEKNPTDQPNDITVYPFLHMHMKKEFIFFIIHLCISDTSVIYIT